jgi:hypothetical protein
MIDDFTVDLFGHPLIKTAAPGFHVKYGNFSTFGRVGGQTAVGVAQHQESIRLLILPNVL